MNRYNVFIFKCYPTIDKKRMAQYAVNILNNSVGAGHSWQCDENGNVYILRNAIIIKKF